MLVLCGQNLVKVLVEIELLYVKRCLRTDMWTYFVIIMCDFEIKVKLILSPTVLKLPKKEAKNTGIGKYIVNTDCLPLKLVLGWFFKYDSLPQYLDQGIKIDNFGGRNERELKERSLVMADWCVTEEYVIRMFVLYWIFWKIRHHFSLFWFSWSDLHDNSTTSNNHNNSTTLCTTTIIGGKYYYLDNIISR